MIKNIVFDLGRVLIDFCPIEYLKQLKYDDETIDKLNEIIFKSQYWQDYDLGLLLHNTDLAKIIIDEHPELENEVKHVLQDDWVNLLALRDDMADFLISLKERGYNIFLLSNISIDGLYFVSKYNFFKYIDGGVYSYEEHLKKPDERIFKNLLQRFNLIPEDTIFIDDKIGNVEAANKLGINGIQHIEFEQTKNLVNNMI